MYLRLIQAAWEPWLFTPTGFTSIAGPTASTFSGSALRFIHETVAVSGFAHETTQVAGFTNETLT